MTGSRIKSGMTMIIYCVAGLISLLGWTGAPWAQSSEESFFHPGAWHQTIKIEGSFAFCDEPVPLDDPALFEAFEKELLLAAWDRPQVLLWLKRAHRVFPYIEQELSRRGLPDDLKYIAVVESALMPHIQSYKNAVGYWQFIQSTARRYGLRVDGDIDQRRNLYHATDAALRYLSDLRAQFGTWTLAAAAYNCGENRVASEIKLQGIDNFYQLYLPLETQRYLFKIVAVKTIMSDPVKFGYALTPSELYLPLEFDRVTVEAKRALPVTIIAQAARSYFKEIKTFNPEIRGYDLVAGTHSLLLPKGAADGFQGRLERLLSKMTPATDQIYVVKPGDTLIGIANKLDVPVGALLVWNNMRLNNHIYPGDRLKVGTRP